MNKFVGAAILVVVVLFTAIVYFLSYNIEYFFNDDKNYVKKNAVRKDQCQRMINVAKKIKFDTDPEPVDNEPLYQIDIYHDGEILNQKLWEECKLIYKGNKEIADSSDYMFIKRYNMAERTRLKAHSDKATYTVSVLLSDTKDFKGCNFFLFDKKTSEKIDSEIDPEERDKYITSLGKKLPIIAFEQGDAVRFDSECLHGVTNLTGGERYLLTIFYGSTS